MSYQAAMGAKDFYHVDLEPYRGRLRGAPLSLLRRFCGNDAALMVTLANREFEFNLTGALVWEVIHAGGEEVMAGNLVSSLFPKTPHAKVLSDVRAFISLLLHCNLLETLQVEPTVATGPPR